MADKGHAVQANSMRLEDAGFDDREKALLRLARCFLRAYVDPPKPHWETALDFSVASFGPEHGPDLAYGMVDVLRAMRETRRTVFNFINPCCKSCAARLTDGERLLMQTIQSVRNNDITRARMDALILCEGYDTDRFLSSVGRLALNRGLLADSRR